MTLKKFGLIFPLMAALALQLACSALAQPQPQDTFSTLNALYTAAAETQTAAPAATVTASPTNPPATAAPVQPVARCDAAAFITDVSYPDGSVLSPGKKFTKTWRIQNTGTCAWKPSYALIFSGGERMGAPAAIDLEQTVYPNETIDLQAPLTAPNQSGEFRGFWMLQNESGALFGVGADGAVPLWADVVVRGDSYAAYEFAPNACEADWFNAGKALPCPGEEGSPKGFVVPLSSAAMEDGVKQKLAALWLTPQDKRDGILSGMYPAFPILAGDRFRAEIGCKFGAKKCDMIFHLDYKTGGEIYTLGSWREVYEGQAYSVEVDLSALAGKSARFILSVSANGGMNQDEGIWLRPRIERLGSKPANTKTPAASSTPTATATPSATMTFTPSPEPPTPSETPTP
ncbi:MAG: hypothetical protein Fur002_09700 [Anaerolineales bacterium]